MKLRTLGQNAALAVGTIVILTLVAELILQFLIPVVYRPRFTRLDAEVGWYHNASVGTKSVLEGHRYLESYNSHGFRSPEHTHTKPPGTKRVVVLGDSFVDGSEVGDDELFTWHLQQAMPGVEVVNLGVYGYSTAQQLLALPRFGLPYDPDLVLVVTMSNDLTGNTVNFSFFGPAPRFLLDGDSVRFEPTSSSAAQAAFRATNLPMPGMHFLHRHSLVYHFLNHRIYQRLRARRIQQLLDEQRHLLSPEERVRLYLELISRMRTVSEGRGAAFAVVLGYERSEVIKGSSPNRGLAERLAERSVPVVDLFTGLLEAETASDSSLYYRTDIHWNARGHRVVADLLRPSVQRLLDLATAADTTRALAPAFPK